MKAGRLFRHLLAAALLCVAASAQTTPGGGRYERDGLSFSYPDGWKIEDKSDARAQHLFLASDGGAGLLMVLAYREPISRADQLRAGNRNIWRPFAEEIARKLSINRDPPWQEMRCKNIGGRSAVGIELDGRLNGEPTTGEIYSLLLGRRFVTVFFIRHDKDEAREAPAWQSLIASIKIEEPPDAPPLPKDVEDFLMDGGTSANPLKKPQPEYPERAKSERAQGQVAVRVEVDENGDVISAQAISGHPLLHGACERAARKAKYAPTVLCGQPAKKTAVITYNFVLSP